MKRVVFGLSILESLRTHGNYHEDICTHIYIYIYIYIYIHI